MQQTGMKHISIFLLAFFSAVALPTAVKAEQPEKPPPPVVMGEVVVTASRQAEAVSRVPAHVTVIDNEMIAQSTSQNVPEILQTMGVHISDFAGNKRAYSVDLRGFGENSQANLLVLVDGRRINQADLSGTDWQLIPLDRIERIEIIRGSRGTVLYGDNATSGVINIITKEGNRTAVNLSAQYGSYDTKKGTAGVSGAIDLLTFDIATTYLTSDGYRDNSDTESKDVSATVRMDPHDQVRINLSGGYHKDNTRLPGNLLKSQLDAGTSRTHTNNPNDFADTQDYYAKVGTEFFFLSDDAFILDLSYRNRSVDQYANFPGGWFGGKTDIDTFTVSPRFTFQESFAQVSNRIIFGADFSIADQQIDNTSDNGGIPSNAKYKLKKNNLGFFIHDELGITRNLSISGGYRKDRATYDFDGHGISYGSPFLLDADRTFKQEAYDVGINYLLGPMKFYAAFGKSFRHPLLDEQFSYFTNTVNVALRAQRSESWDFGTRFNFTESAHVTLNFFRITTDNEIFLNPANYANENLDGETRRDGLELMFRFSHQGWSLGAGYTYTDAKIDGGQYDNRTIPNVPAHRAHATIGYRFDFGLFVGLEGNYIGTRYLISDFRNADIKQTEYTLVNAKVQYQWRGLTFFVDLNNVLNQSYAEFGGIDAMAMEPSYYPSPEFNFLAGITVRFGEL